ncbi:hypothetical protein OH460_07895 [Vibrio sp. Makdt]|uniref:hypothetical protein n=1 Tax=Vibrio sp. Makdt TaxID=2998828 RepID=UPI0022CD52AB|nr:hypothetical protein [Vibrio sp. Makdt]MDA0152219.1 hypothetical protein [Vibrio sp. Makdt]
MNTQNPQINLTTYVDQYWSLEMNLAVPNSQEQFALFVECSSTAKLIGLRDVNTIEMLPCTWMKLQTEWDETRFLHKSDAKYGSFPIAGRNSRYAVYVDFDIDSGELLEIRYNLTENTPRSIRIHKNHAKATSALNKNCIESVPRELEVKLKERFAEDRVNPELRKDHIVISNDYELISIDHYLELCLDHSVGFLNGDLPTTFQSYFEMHTQRMLNELQLGSVHQLLLKPAIWDELLFRFNLRFKSGAVLSNTELVEYVSQYITLDSETKAYEVSVIELYEQAEDPDHSRIHLTELSREQFNKLEGSQVGKQNWITYCGVTIEQALTICMTNGTLGGEYQITKIGPFDAQTLNLLSRGLYQFENKGHLARINGHELPIEVVEMNNKFFIGTTSQGELMSRESLHYYPTEITAKFVLATHTWTQREFGQKPICSEEASNEASGHLAELLQFEPITSKPKN